MGVIGSPLRRMWCLRYPTGAYGTPRASGRLVEGTGVPFLNVISYLRWLTVVTQHLTQLLNLVALANPSGALQTAA